MLADSALLDSLQKAFETDDEEPVVVPRHHASRVRHHDGLGGWDQALHIREPGVGHDVGLRAAHQQRRYLHGASSDAKPVRSAMSASTARSRSRSVTA